MAEVKFIGESKSVRHGTKLLKVGDCVECSDADADGLIARGDFEITREKSKPSKKKSKKKSKTNGFEMDPPPADLPTVEE